MPVSTASAPGTTSNSRGKALPDTHSTTNGAHPLQLLPLPLAATQEQPPPTSVPPAPASGGASEAASSNSPPHCKHCEEFGVKGGGGGVYWRLHLDRDLLETIISIYPEWFKDCNVSPGAMAEGGPSGLGATPPSSPGNPSSGGLRRKSVSSAASVSSSSPPHSPPKAQVDDSPLQKCMDRNKESLKVKLMLRRPINQLVAQGIMPPLKTPPAFHEQRQKLERAKTGDLLKAKIQQRPNRTELVRQHILEADMGHVDPSLAERQRMLKKARLQDTLNDQLSHRPGPLELIQKNILHTEEIIERAVKEGQISFKATCEGHLTRPQHPSQYITFEEDSGGSSEGAAASPPSSSQLPIVSAVPPDTPSVPHSPGLASTTSSLSPLSSVSSPQSVAPLPPPPPPPPPPLPTSTTLPPPPPAVPSTTRTTAHVAQVTIGTVSSQMPVPSPLSSVSTTPSTTLSQVSPLSAVLSAHREQVSSSSSKNRKKSKTKSQPKTRTIKFHEYKGPPNAQRNSSSLVSPPPVETSYELLLQQQQLFLQWQLEWQHKYPQIILPAAQKPSDVGLITVAAPTSTATSNNAVQGSASVPPPTPPPQPPPPTTPIFLQAQSPGFSSSQGSASGSTPLPTASITTTTVSNPILSPASTVSVSLSTPVSSLKDVAALRCLPPKMEDMKVNDLKSELKKRNLPVSGSKPQLIERLRMYAEAAPSAGGSTCLQMGSSPPPPPPLPRTSLSSNPSPSQQTVFGMDAGLEDSLPPLGIDSPVLSPSGTSMDALSSPSPPPPSPLHLQSKSNQPPASAVTLQVFSPASEMEVDPEAAVVVILAPQTSSSPAQGSSSPPPPTPIQASPLSPPASSSSPPLRPPPPPPPLPPPPQLTGSCVVSSSTQSATDDNTIIGNDIIAQQQKKIKELQRELLRSQFQLQCERQKEQLLLQQQKQLASQQQIPTQTQQRTAGGNAASANELKPTHRLVLQQHIQNKIQQQNLQEQLQHLQKMQLQQKQQQLQLQQKQKQALPAKQQEMQQQLQVAANARANLAAFLQSQNSSTSTADNNNSPQATNINSNNNNNNNNLKKGTNDQEQKVLLSQRNELNKSCVKPALSGNKVTPGTTPNGIVGHHRAASVSSFFGNTFAPSKVTQQQPPMSPAQQIQKSQVVLVPEEMLRKTDELGNGSEGSLTCLKPSMSPPLSPAPSPATPPTTQQFLITYSPPHYEEATKPLKIKLEPGSSYANTGGGGGNLDSSRGTSNKSVKSQIVDDVLEILIKNGELPPSAANDPSTPTTPGRSQGLIFSSNLPGQQNAPINSMVNHQIGQPLFADIHKVKTEEIPNESKHIPSHHSNSQHVFHPFDFVLGADTSPTPLHRVASHESAKHCEENPSHELMPLQQTEDLGLDLDVLDAMEFDLLGAPSHHPTPSHVDMGPVSPVTPDGRGMDHISDIHIHSSMPRDEDVDMEAVVGPGASGELSEMPMDLDVSDWLDSLIAPASGVAQSGNSSPFHQQQSVPQHNQYDPLLSHTHDPFDLFDDTELRMAAWDRVDFAA